MKYLNLNGKINVLSLFDGMSCGQIALNRVGIKYDNYFASEIDKHAINETMANFPNTIQLGDIKKWREWNIDFSKINLLIAGFPCQSWSIAGKMSGINDYRGRLMFDMMDIYNHIKSLNPKIKFLFENVKMKKQFQEYVDAIIGVKSIFIDSKLVSAQNRNRQYWTNIENVQLPNDKNIYLNDILEIDIENGLDVIFKDGEFISYAKNGKKIILSEDSKPPYTIYETRSEFGKKERSRLSKLLGRDTTPRSKEHKEYRPLSSGKSNCILTSINDLDYIIDKNLKFRSYTINELCRLQTVPDDYFKVSSDTQIRKMLGNGWTVDVIAHIFKGML